MRLTPKAELIGHPKGYIIGLVRDYPYKRLAHLYKGDFADPGLPMCRYGWNRKEDGYSIWRGVGGRMGVCKTCKRRAWANLDGVPNPYEEGLEDGIEPLDGELADRGDLENS